MARRLVLLVTLLAACGQDLPKPIYIESRFDDTETAAILAAIDQINLELGQELLGHDVLTYAGRWTDPDGFSPDDYSDDIHVMYKGDTDSDYYRWLHDVNNRDYGGYCTLSDALIFTRFADDPVHFHHVVLHEMGHFLEMLHDPDPTTIMHPGPDSNGQSWTLKDKQAFCVIYDCKFPPR